MRLMVLVKASKDSEAGEFSGPTRAVIDGPFAEAPDFGPALIPELREFEERLRAQATAKRWS